MQTRRVLLLFALVLGLTALVASVAPPPKTAREAPDRLKPKRPALSPIPAARTAVVRLRAGDGRRFEPATRRVPGGSSVSLSVSVPEAGDVLVDGLGMRTWAEPRAPVRLDFLAPRSGRFPVTFVPLRGKPRRAGELVFRTP